jgi:hypothetical protein
MLSHGVKQSEKAEIHLTVNELRQIVHWARVGLEDAKGGAYFDETPITIREMVRRMKDQRDRCLRLT